jgi:hypothetical protein
MECRYRVLLRCPSCERVFCAPELAGSAVVFHLDCGARMKVVGSFGSAEHADRVNVIFSEERNQLEVSTRAEG